MYMGSDRPGGYGESDLWVLRRGSVDAAWGLPENLGSVVNSPKVDGVPCISADGLTLYFNSTRSGGYGSFDIYTTTRATRQDPWKPPVNLGPTINSSGFEGVPWISTDGLDLYFASSKAGGYGSWDIYVARRTTANGPWGDPVNLGPVVNSSYTEGHISLSPDGLLLLFSDDPSYAPRPGGYGGCDMWMTRRASRSEPWQAPVNLGPKVNGSAVEIRPRIALDGSTLYFCTQSQAGVWNNWQAPILPVVDFNADKKVDLVDLVMLIDNWGMNKTLCDIGPMPWGDGKVDIEDLKVFMTYYEKENPPKPKDAQ